MSNPTHDNLLLPISVDELGRHVPVKILQDLVDEASKNQEISKNATKEALINGVCDLVKKNIISSDKINKIVQEYRFAGRVSVCWGNPLERLTLSKQKLEEMILEKGYENSFDEEIKPQLTQKPAFNKSEWLNSEMLRLEFTYAGKSYEIEDNYIRRVIYPTKRLNSYIRLLDTTFVVETRASIRESKLVHDSLSRLLGIEVVPMTFSNQDISKIKKELNAKSKATKHKRLGGDLDMASVSASPDLDDLEDSDEYNSHFSQGDLREARLEFTYIPSSLHSIESSLHISNQGNIWFMRDVPEELIEYVFTIVKKIKFLPSLKKIGLPSQISENDEEKIQALIASIRKNGYGKRFSPRIYETLGLDVDERKWMETISKLVQLGHIVERFELICAACHKTANIYLNYNEIPLDESVACIHCGQESLISEKDVFLTYSFKEDIKFGENVESSIKEEDVFLED
jgi:hypothetical protein